MTAGNFSRSLQKVLKYEGGYSNDAGDPGGATMWGITHIDYDAYRKSKGLATRDVRKLTVAERDEIYREKYWAKSRCDELPGGIDFVVFDGSVNSGIGQSIKWLQRAVGVAADGRIGAATMAAVLDAGDNAALVRNICSQRLKFLKSLRHWKIFGKGWERRVTDVRTTGLAWLDDEPAALPTGAGKAIASADDVIEDETTFADKVTTAVGYVGTAGEAVGAVVTAREEVKSLIKSRISWGATALGATSTATAVASAPPTLWEKFIDIWKNPIWWLVLLNILLTLFIIYRYWRDHGYGLLKKDGVNG